MESKQGGVDEYDEVSISDAVAPLKKRDVEQAAGQGVVA